MKKTFLFFPSLLLLFFCLTAPLKASHLDGLWRNDRLQMTVRIEQEDDGFRAKRTDQGVWYHYATDDQIHFTDRYGNWYDLIDDHELVWNEVSTSKRISFTKVDYRDEDRWDNYGNDPNQNDNANWDRWNNNYTTEDRSSIEGQWYGRGGRDNLQVITFKDGIKVNNGRDGWERFYVDRTGNRFKDKYGNTITLSDRDRMVYRNQYEHIEQQFTRTRHWNRDEKNWRD